MAEWYVVRKKKEHGPFQDAQLKSLATSGKIKEHDLLRRSDQKSTVTAKSIGGLFVSAPSIGTPAATPACTPAATPKKSGIWMKAVYFLMFCVMVSQVLKMIGLMRGEKNHSEGGRSTQSEVALTKDAPNQTLPSQAELPADPQLVIGKRTDGEVLSADYLPPFHLATFYFKRTMFDVVNGVPLGNETVTLTVHDPDNLIRSGENAKPTNIKRYQSTKAIHVTDDGGKWQPLVALGARAGDSWISADGRHRYTLYSLDGAPGKRKAVIFREHPRSETLRREGVDCMRDEFMLVESIGVTAALYARTIKGGTSPQPHAMIEETLIDVR
jgi:hypothetical protein